MEDNIWEYPFGDIMEDDDDMLYEKPGSHQDFHSMEGFRQLEIFPFSHIRRSGL